MSNDLVEHCAELLAPLGAVRWRRMFGGHGIYVDDLFVALIAEQCLYLKVDALTQPSFAAMGCVPFMYTGKTAPVTISYWTVPPQAMESSAEMLPWARLALAAARRALLSNPTGKRAGARSTTPRRGAVAAATRRR